MSHHTQCYDFDFTEISDPLPDLVTFVTAMRSLSKKWTFQLEKAPTTGKLHYQGRMSLFKKKRQPELVKLLQDTVLPNMYVSESSQNSRNTEAFYTLKLDTRVEGPWSDTTWKEPEYIPRQYRGLLDRVHPWQKDVLDSRHTFNDRIVHLVYDPLGNNGKSTVAALASLHYGGYDLPPVGDHKELTQMLCDMLMAKDDRTPSFVFIDLPRALTCDAKRFSPFMVAIEQIKKGHVADARYHYKDWWYDSPQVWVMCNHLPDVTMMSQDRWRFHTIEPYFKTLESLSQADILRLSQI